jgi:hypothetical protein
MFLDIIHHTFFCLKTSFQRLDSAPVFRQNLLSWGQLIDLVHISGHQHQVIMFLPEDGDRIQSAERCFK